MRLYRSDGTAAGTVSVSNAIPGVRQFTRLWTTTRHVYIKGHLSLHRSDGRATVKVQSRSGWDRVAEQLVEMGGIVYFLGYDRSGSGLWRTDGTSNGTRLVIDLLRPFSSSSSSSRVARLLVPSGQPQVRRDIADSVEAGRSRGRLGEPTRIARTLEIPALRNQ